MSARGLFVAALALAGCGGNNGIPAVTRGPLAVRSVDWNANQADLGKIAAVTDLADTAAVFSDKGLTELVAGAVSATDLSVVAWESAGVIPAADGEGQWIVGVDATGAVYTIDAETQLQNVSDRWGLIGQHVHGVASLGGSGVAFQLDGGLAVADGATVTSYAVSMAGMTGAKGRVAGVSDGKFHVFDLGTGKDSAFSVPDASFVTFDDSGKLVGATHHALYMEDDKGGMARLIDLGTTNVHGLAGAPSGVWVAMDGEVGLLSGSTLGESSGAGLPADAELIASSSGDVWALSQGKLLRYSAASPGDQSLWQSTVQPVFDRVCSQCHLPGGSANIDLSYYGAWVARRQLIDQRVFDKMPTQMPPTSASVQLTTDDLAAIKAWIDDGS